ncbi:hypothetical protein HOG48_00055 [Candidatus Peregrinibacteria bacterium]|nr:hypothetical protein [Candidatus Peregrinibacteria bacterium]
MVAASRYNVGGNEADVMKNKLDITDPKELGDAETVLLTDAYDHFLELLKNGKLKLNLGLLFMPPNQIEKALEDFKVDFEDNKPQKSDSKAIIAKKTAFLYCELNVIHPFREGNGRATRLFIDLLLENCGYEGLDFTKIPGDQYIAACRKGTLRDYKFMEEIVLQLLKKKCE